MRRIQKKLYLSSKVLKSNYDVGKLVALEHQADTKALIRAGLQALDNGEDHAQDMLSWDLEKILSRCKVERSDRPYTEYSPEEALEAERKLLKSVERVECRIFEGETIKKAKEDPGESDLISANLTRADRRRGKNTVVEVDGWPVLKEGLVASQAPHPIQQEVKKPLFDHQKHCQVCGHKGKLMACLACPRAYHVGCSEISKSHGSLMQFRCPHHKCTECGQNSQQAGGLLYRCRKCEDAFCEKCMDFEGSLLLGNTLEDFEDLGYGRTDSAFYIECKLCRNKGQKQKMKKARPNSIAVEPITPSSMVFTGTTPSSAMSPTTPLSAYSNVFNGRASQKRKIEYVDLTEE